MPRKYPPRKGTEGTDGLSGWNRSKKSAKAYLDALQGLYGTQVQAKVEKAAKAKFGASEAKPKEPPHRVVRMDRVNPDVLKGTPLDNGESFHVERPKAAPHPEKLCEDSTLPNNVLIFTPPNTSKQFDPEKPLPEWREQVILVDWAKKTHPFLRDFITSNRNEGIRTPAQMQFERMMGFRRGLSDLFIFRPAMGYHGLYLEMKQDRTYRPSERCSETWKEEEAFIELVKSVGYQAHFAFGWKHGAILINQYFGIT